MDHFYNFIKDKAVGFYITVGTSLLSLITAILYLAFYVGGEYMSWPVFMFLFGAFLLPAAVITLIQFLPMLKKAADYLPAIIFGFNLAALLFYAVAIFPFVTTRLVGVDSSSINLFNFGAAFSASVILLVNLLVLSAAAAFFPQLKTEAEAVNSGGKVIRLALSYVARVYTVLTSIVFGLLIVGTPIAMNYKATISAYLKQPTFKIVKTEDDEGDVLNYYKSDFENIADLREAGYALSEEVMQEGAVLLKNDDDALPLSEGDVVSLFGATSVDPVFVGTGSGNAKVLNPSNYKASLENAGLIVNSQLWSWYTSNKSTYGRVASGEFPTRHTINDANWSQINTSAKTLNAEAAIFVFGRVGGEAGDLNMLTFSESGNTKKGYLQISDKENDVLLALKQQKDAGVFNKIIVIINSSNQVETEILKNPAYGIDAALWVGGLGQSGINAIGKLLTGEVNPSGRLSDMFWNKHEYNPVHANFGVYRYGTGALQFTAYPGNYDFYVVYQEGMYVGYRYAETRYEDYVLEQGNAGNFIYGNVVTYPFGHGLSYTEFEYSNFNVEKVDRNVEVGKNDSKKSIDKTFYEVSLTVKNTGQRSGKEVVQVYMQRPYTQYDINNGIEKPSVELVGFTKTKELQPGESVNVNITVDEKYFAAFDAYLAGTYVLTEGPYYLAVGKNAHDALNNILAAKGKTQQNTDYRMDDDGNAAFAKVVLNNSGVNTQKYKYSDATGNEIKSLFDFVDLNRYEGRGSNSVTYITRNNWTGTVKFAEVGKGTSQSTRVLVTLTPQMQEAMANNFPNDPDTEYPTYGTYSDGTPFDYDPDDDAFLEYHADKVINLAELALQLEDGTPAIPYDDPMWDKFLDQLSWHDMVTLLINGKRNTQPIPSVAKPGTLDHNGPMGFCERYDTGNGLAKATEDPLRTSYPTCYPSNGIVAATYNVEIAERVGKMIGEDGLWSGHNGLYGTGINIHRTPYAGRAFEYYSEDPILSGKIVAKFSEGIQSKGVYVYNKHFALNEQEYGRFGLSTWCNEQAMREIYLRAFEIPIAEGGAKCIMGGLNRIGAVWASASKELNTDWLRGEAGLTGFVVTDWWDLSGKNPETYYMQPGPTLLAGTDLPDGELLYDQIDRFKEQNGYGNIAWAMRESAHRIMYTVAHSNAMNGFTAKTRVKNITPPWVTQLNVAYIASACLFSLSVLGLAILALWDPVKKLLIKSK